MNIRYHVELTQAERCELTALVSGGQRPVRKLKRAQILLAAEAGLSDEAIAAGVAVGGSTVYRTKRRFVEDSLEAALSESCVPEPGAAQRQGGSPADRHGLFEPARRPCPLDAGAVGRCVGQAHRA